MLIRRPAGIVASEITPPEVYARRREFIKATGALALGPGLGVDALPASAQGKAATMKLFGAKESPLSTREKKNSRQEITEYNNFYEFGTDKTDPAQNAHTLITRPWTVAVEGEVRKPKVFDIDELMKLAPLEERVYRMRCVEGWSMVIPWVGSSLAELVKRSSRNVNARYVDFDTLADPQADARHALARPRVAYVEGLRLDEAMHPLTLLCRRALRGDAAEPVRRPGARRRPWKYGFKSGKSIVRIRFVEKEPRTAWNKAAPREYGFTRTSIPTVDHPRWSQGPSAGSASSSASDHALQRLRR